LSISHGIYGVHVHDPRELAEDIKNILEIENEGGETHIMKMYDQAFLEAFEMESLSFTTEDERVENDLFWS
jgi:hypothetical protein